MSDLQKMIEDIGQQAIERHQKEQADAIKEKQLELVSKAFDQAAAYTVVVIFGAYAAIFTIWAYTREHLDKTTSYWVALLLGISVVAFVAFEVFKMVVNTYTFMGIRRLFVDGLQPAELLKRHADLSEKNNLLIQRLIMPLWVLTVGVSVLAGFGSAGILIETFVAHLGSS